MNLYVLHMYIDFDLPQLHLKFHNKKDIDSYGIDYMKVDFDIVPK